MFASRKMVFKSRCLQTSHQIHCWPWFNRYDADAPRITIEQVDEILHSNLSLPEMIAEINAIHGYPDYIWRGDPGEIFYWLDEKENDVLNIAGETWFYHSKLYDNGTIKEISALYPPDFDFETVPGPTDGAKPNIHHISSASV